MYNYSAKIRGGAGTKTMEHMSTKAFSKKNRSTTTPHFFSVILVPYTKIFSIQKSDPPPIFLKIFDEFTIK